MDAVLGLSVTPSAVGLVLVQGQDSDGDTMDGTGFEVDAGGSWNAVQTSEQAVEAVLRAEAIAAGRGHRVQSIGVTWSDKADAEAALLLKSLSDSGFGNIVPVRLSEATDALARGIAEVAGYRTTAVCVIEPEHLIALVVAPQQGAVQTAVNHSVVTEQDLAGWLSTVFSKADWRPEALVLVGSAEDLDGLRPVLQDALSVPVFTPAEAQLALARGAALACAQTAEFRLDNSVRAVVGDDLWDVAGNSTAGTEQPTPLRRGARHRTQVGPAAVLAAGVVTFVASASAALALQAAPERSDPQARAGADASARAPLAVRGTTPAPLQQSAPKREAAPLAAPEVAQPPTAEVAQPPTAEVAQPPTALAAPVPDARQISQEAALAVAMRLEPEAPAAPPPLDAPPAPFGAAPPDMMTPDAVPPQEPPGLVQRIRDRLSGPDQPPVDVPPPPGAPLP
ncbi:MAG: hypothetical protein K0U70_04640 [Actinomycetia bacterium]|nr:hypothetical protein [Actinomycetes bacterium]MCH9709141.1 hypothetical protein [Actinomycetes bacterium]MCH9767068.1 hypothetical protein [Actinomycetes bacterium]